MRFNSLESEAACTHDVGMSTYIRWMLDLWKVPDDLGECVGIGRTGPVRRAFDRAEGRVVAVKTFESRNSSLGNDLEALLNEEQMYRRIHSQSSSARRYGPFNMVATHID